MIAQANAICTRRNRELTATTRPGASLPQILRATPRRAGIERKALGELVHLTPPAAVAGDWRKLVLATAAVLARTVALEQLVGRTDRAGVARETALLNKSQVRLLVSGSRAGTRQCAVVAGPSLRPF